MTLDPITKDMLKRGDILLCNIPKLSFWQYMSSIEEMLANYISTGQIGWKAATPLIHWGIGYFDECHYCHASFWNGDKVVESRIQGGLRANDISTYSEDTVDVYRYHRDGHWLGDISLPVDPLLQKAQALVDKEWPYGFDSAYLLGILCVTRWHRAEWVDCIRDFMVRHAYFSWLEEWIEDIFNENRPQIDALIEKLIVAALEVVRKYRERKGFVCSQTVAVIYNEAVDAEHAVGAYKIDKPTYSVSSAPPVLVAPPSTEEEEVAAWEDTIQKLRAQLAQLPMPTAPILSATSRTDYETWQADLRADTFYTPRDLAESSNTELVGQLKL